MMACMNIPLAETWMELSGVLFVLFGGVWTYCLWRKDVKKQRVEAYERVLTTYLSSGIADAFERWRCKRQDGVRIADDKELKRDVEKFLPFLDHVCYLRRCNMIEAKAYREFFYPISVVTNDEDMDEYLGKEREKWMDEFPYESITEDMMTRKKPARHSTNCLTEGEFVRYLENKFGGMTDSAQSVKARASVVIKKLGVSMDDAVKDRETAQRTIQRIEIEFADKSNAQISNYKNAIRHCFVAKHGEQL